MNDNESIAMASHFRTRYVTPQRRPGADRTRRRGREGWSVRRCLGWSDGGGRGRPGNVMPHRARERTCNAAGEGQRRRDVVGKSARQRAAPCRAEPTCRLSRPRPLCTAPGGDCVVTDSSHHSVARCRYNRIFVAHLLSLSLSLPCAKNNHTRRQTRSSLFCRDGFLYF